jgi:hypothetical protein
MIAAGGPREYSRASQPLLRLIQELGRKKELDHVYIRKGDFSLVMKKRI